MPDNVEYINIMVVNRVKGTRSARGFPGMKHAGQYNIFFQEVVMDWKVFLSSFGVVFLAELGDKTQLAGLNLAAKTKMPFLVFLGSVTAYAVVTLITVMLGDTLTKFINPEIIRYGAALLFVLIGILIFSGKL